MMGKTNGFQLKANVELIWCVNNYIEMPARNVQYFENTEKSFLFIIFVSQKCKPNFHNGHSALVEVTF